MRGRRRGAPDQDRWSRADWWGVVIDAPDPGVLGRFYAGLLDWELVVEDADGCALDPGEGVANVPTHQPQDHVRVLLDPAGHPFCLYAHRVTDG